jgi:protein-tyrosine phosphatase
VTAEGTPCVLVVCTGNLCRSPLAAALLERELAAAGIEADIESAGLAAPFRRPPDRRLLRVADEVGLDLSGHRSEMLTLEQVQRADLVLTMTAEQRRQLEALSPDGAARAAPLRSATWKAQILRGRRLPFGEWAARLAADVPVAERPRVDPSNDIADPIGGPLREYRVMANELGSLVSTLVTRWSGR